MGLFGRNRPIFDPPSTLHTTNTYQIEGKRIVCPQCGEGQFDHGRALLNTAGMTFFGLDWANRSATILCCRRCSRIEWYMQQPEELS